MYPLHVLADGRLRSSLDAMTTDAVVAAGGGLATARSWTGGATPMVLAASLALLMALVSLVRGVRAFSFGLTWWGKHGRLRLRVESYATLAEAGQGGVAGGGSISGIFCAELVEGGEAGDGEGGVAGELRLLDDEEDEEDGDEGGAEEEVGVGGVPAREDGGGGANLLQTKKKQSRRVVGGSAEMGFYFYHKTHHDYASPAPQVSALASLSALDYCSGAGCCDYCGVAASQLDLRCGWPNSVLYQEEEEKAEQQLVADEKHEEQQQQQQQEEEAAEEDSGARRPHLPPQCSAMHGIQSKASLHTFTMPDWACTLLEPLQISAAFSRRTSVAPSNRKCVKLKQQQDPNPDFPLLRLQLTAEVFRGRRRRHRGGILAAGKSGRSPSSSHVVLRGDKLTATSRDDVVRIWERRRGHPVETLYLPPGDSVAAMDVNWDAGVAAVGTAGGLLSLWDLERALSAGTSAAHRGQVGALHIVPGTAAGTLSVTGGPAEVGGKAVSSVSVWDSRLLAAEGASTTGSSVAAAVAVAGTDLVVQGLRAQGHQIFVRDAQGCISGLDLRKLVSMPIDTVPAELVAHHCAQQLPSSSASLSPPPIASSAGGGRLGTERSSSSSSRRSQDSLLVVKESSSGRTAAAAAAARSEESRWWEKEIGYGSEEDDEEDGWPNGILCTYPTEASGKPSWIGRLIGEIKTQLHLGGGATIVT